MANRGLLQINEVLAQYTKDIDSRMDKVLKTTAKEAKEKLRDNSPSNTGDYEKGWSVKQEKGKYIVHNKTNYQLTHLLENGHDVVAYGQKVGHASAHPHIKDVESWVQEEVMKRLEDTL